MKEYINLKIISPISEYKFDNENKEYELIIIYNENDDIVRIYKYIIKNIRNIDEYVKGVYIKENIEIIKNEGKKIIIKIIEKEKNEKKKMRILFSGELEERKTENNKKTQIIKLKSPKKETKIEYKNKMSYLDERIHNIECNEKNIAYIFYEKNKDKIIKVKEPIRINIKEEKNNVIFYNRYNKIYTTEEIKEKIEDNKNILEIYNKRIKNNKRNQKEKNKELYKKRIMKISKYKNNILKSPIDGKISKIEKISTESKINIFDNIIELKKMIEEKKIKEIKKGYFILNGKNDNKKIYMPYGGVIKEIKEKVNEKSYGILMKIKTEYYMPENIKERNYAALLNGNYIHTNMGVGAGWRAYPERLKKQPNTELEYYILIVGYDKKLLNIKNKKIKNKKRLETGEEIGEMGENGGYIYIFINREIKYSTDIEKYTKKNILTYVRGRDTIGEIL